MYQNLIECLLLENYKNLNPNLLPMITQEFPKGKEEYCPRCYFEDEVVILREDCPHRTTKQDKFQKIMEVMSDKTLSFGCVISDVRLSRIVSIDYELAWFYRMIDDWENSYSGNINWSEIIWHPLHIWDVLDWIEKNLPKATWLTVEWVDLLSYWKDKRLPLSPTDEELIDYIYNLLP